MSEVEGDTGAFDLTFTQTTFEDPSMLNGIPPFNVLLDTGSTIESFKDSELLGNIRATKERVTALTNGGSTTYSMKGSFKGLMHVWYHPKGLANIIFMKSLASVSHVTYDSSRENAFVATFDDGDVWRFVEAPNGLFVWNTVIPNKRNNGRVINYCLVSTVADNEHRVVDLAKLAGKLHRLLGYPAHKTFEHAIKTCQIKNCPVQVEDVKRYFKIYGPNVATLQGKTTKKRSPGAPTRSPCPLPPDLLRNHRDVTLCIDIFYVQGIPFSTRSQTKSTFERRRSSQIGLRSLFFLNFGLSSDFTRPVDSISMK